MVDQFPLNVLIIFHYKNDEYLRLRILEDEFGKDASALERTPIPHANGDSKKYEELQRH